MEIALKSGIKLELNKPNELLKSGLYIFKWDGTSKLIYEVNKKVLLTFPVEDFQDFFIVPGKTDHLPGSTFYKDIQDSFINKCMNEAYSAVSGDLLCDSGTIKLRMQPYGDVQILNRYDDLFYSFYEIILTRLFVIITKPLDSSFIQYIDIRTDWTIPFIQFLPDQYLTTLKYGQGWSFAISEWDQSSDRWKLQPWYINGVRQKQSGRLLKTVHNAYYNTLYFFQGDLSCIFHTGLGQVVNLKWSFSDIYSKPFMKSTFSFEKIKSLNISKNAVYLSTSETGTTQDIILYKTEQSLNLTLVVIGSGDIIVYNRLSGQVYWSLYQTIIDNYVAYYRTGGALSDSDLKDVTKVQPTITTAKYKLDISKVIYVCGPEEYDITGFFLAEYNKVVKTSSDIPNFGTTFWLALKSKTPDCMIERSLKIEWKFNDNKGSKTFNENNVINLAIETSCRGDYGLCINGNRKWEVITDSYPLSTCKPTQGASITCTDPVDCVGEWANISACEDGMKTSTYFVTTPAKEGGKPCEYENFYEKSEPCSITACVGSWGEWSNCLGSSQFRTYTVTTEAANGGLACSNKTSDIDTRVCKPSKKPQDTTTILIGVSVAFLILFLIMMMV